ncbi:MAG TPA: hypothetical protein VGR89_14870, partial [Puia sp.]|nr:hypothetical protein [Puia sp.]
MESPDLQHIDDFFRDTLRQKDRAPSFAVWDRVEAGLDTRRRRTLLFWWLTGAGSAVILLIGGILTQSLRRETQRLQPENRAISSATRVSLPGTCLSSDPAIASNPAPAGAHAAPRTATPDASASPAGSSACAVHASSTSADLIIGRPPASVPAAHLPLSVPYAR